MSPPAFVRITRPFDSLAVGALVLASCLVAGATGGDLPTVFLAVLGAALVAAGGYVLNDVFDYETDEVVHQERVLPRGEMGRSAAGTYGLLLLSGAFFFALVNAASFLDAVLAAALLALYSWRLKRSNGVLGNLAVALLGSNAVLIGGFVMGNLRDVLALAVCVFFATLAREIAKDVEDLPGDRLTRRRTLPMLIGSGASGSVAAFSLLVAALAAYLPYFQGIFGRAYLFAATAVNALVLWAAVRLLRGTAGSAAMSQRLIKAGMFSYIVVFLIVGVHVG